MSEKTPTAARRFLEALFRDKPAELYILLWILPEKRSKWFRDLDSAINYSQPLASHDVYVGVALAAQDYGIELSPRSRSSELSDIHPKVLAGLCMSYDLQRSFGCHAFKLVSK